MKAVGVLAISLLVALAGCVTVNAPPPAASGPAPLNQPVPSFSSSTSTEIKTPSPTSSSSTTAATQAPPPPAPPGRNWTTDPWSLAKDGWAPAAEAVIFPGVQVQSFNGGCTVNFVFTDPNGTTVYVGTSAHCAAHPRELSEDPGNPDYCSFLEPPKGQEQLVAYFDMWADWPSDPEAPAGTYVYNSNMAMYGNETDARTCLENDFALIEVAPEWRHLVNPSVDHWGGPTGLRPGGEPAFGEKAYTVGGTLYRTGTPAQQPVPPVQETTRPREGFFDHPLIWAESPWSTEADFVGQCLGGDSGSAILDKEGKAFAVMEAAVPTGNHCRVSYLEPMLEYMSEKTGRAVVLQLGTESFESGILPEVP